MRRQEVSHFSQARSLFDNYQPDKQLLPMNQFTPASQIDFLSIILTTVLLRGDYQRAGRKLAASFLAMIAR
ncbi:hypothetical protein Plim_0281 [Planctopirus limnophila DSM 3776]|uniref:Uncharacterized protein n=1 Tax=Planctopirus limnophila (strain ATCC 43296 / DSM 3776 / IFAM 1008 / Mu 290) TaxID=521674 RepID=D5SNX7_PLAL2|nr:hypothetical protein [Planctopirus limnophila]ADG66132.1 hypothetical protein Plim_0281 [Planctopirus limnophila DSM 3776]